jgi:hypothetical protein
MTKEEVLKLESEDNRIINSQAIKLNLPTETFMP